MNPPSGCSLVRETALVLVDRGFFFGDVVKRQPTDATSGTVIRTSLSCTLKPVYAGLSVDAWPYRESDNILHHIPTTDLQLVVDYRVGDQVIYHDWLGLVEDVFEEVAIRLSDGSVVVLASLAEVDVPGPVVMPSSSARNLAQLVSQRHDRCIEFAVSPDSDLAESLHPGQLVSTTRSNIRLGQWLHGHYDPSVSPIGTIVRISTETLKIDWVSRNLYSTQKKHQKKPPSTVEAGNFWELIIYQKGRRPSESKSTALLGNDYGCNIGVGDYVTFCDISGAAVKYAGQAGSQGMFRRVPAYMTQGFDMNTFLVVRTKMKVSVQWQDASISEEEATSLVHYVTVDDHDVWPGEIVTTKGEEGMSTQDRALGSVEDLNNADKTMQVGVVQWTNASDRLTCVRWFSNPSLKMVDVPEPTILPGSSLGELSMNKTTVSMYEISTHPALNARRSSIVLLSPLLIHDKLHQHTATALNRLEGSPMSVMMTEASQHISLNACFGEVIDLGLDGQLVVRLGLLDKIQDIQVSATDVITLLDGESDFVPSSLSDNGSWASDSDAASEDAMDVTYEYEGGTRLDTESGEELWTTDDENLDSPTEIPIDSSTNGYVSSELLLPRQTVPVLPKHGKPHQQDVKFTSYSSMPAQFELLDGSAPSDHHFLTQSVILTASLMRRIWKEHGILETSLPEGIWVRGWEDNLSLLRVIIIGPQDTPYSLAPFVIDFRFKADFPRSPPQAYFHSWTNGTGRINPNLYEDGKVCLSLLGTWPGNSQTEGWSENSSMLQVLVSLMGLVLVEEPFYSESELHYLLRFVLLGHPDTRHPVTGTYSPPK